VLICECRSADGADVCLPEAFEEFLDVFLLGEVNMPCLAVPCDVHAKDVGDLSKICHAIMFLKLLFVAEDYLQILASHGEVINI